MGSSVSTPSAPLVEFQNQLLDSLRHGGDVKDDFALVSTFRRSWLVRAADIGLTAMISRSKLAVVGGQPSWLMGMGVIGAAAKVLVDAELLLDGEASTHDYYWALLPQAQEWEGLALLFPVFVGMVSAADLQAAPVESGDFATAWWKNKAGTGSQEQDTYGELSLPALLSQCKFSGFLRA